LRRGLSLVIAHVDSEDQLAAAEKVFKQHGSQSVDALQRELEKAA
jgi:hypothetical protein